MEKYAKLAGVTLAIVFAGVYVIRNFGGKTGQELVKKTFG